MILRRSQILFDEELRSNGEYLGACAACAKMAQKLIGWSEAAANFL